MKDDIEGHFVAYKKRNFRADSLAMIEKMNAIISEYSGMAMTLRQLYYQLVARDIIPNSETSYNKIGDLLNDGRMAGLISWTAIEDRGRNLMGLNCQTSPAGAIKSVLANYRIDKWEGQPFRPEVWVEKAALEGVIGSICNELQVDFFACRGYNSQSEQWRAGRRLSGYVRDGQRPIIFHLGDHDPSGIDMTRDNQERLSLFAGVQIQVVRLALNMDQIDLYKPPPNPAKSEDSRFADYAAKFGDESWELDALEPKVIHQLISDAVLRIRDEKLWDEKLKEEASDRMALEDMADQISEDEGDE